MIQGTLFQGRTRPKESTVEAVVLVFGLSLMVNKLSDCIEQAPSGATCRRQVSTVAMTFLHGLHLFQRPFIDQTHCGIALAVRLAQDFEEVVHRFMTLDLPL